MNWAALIKTKTFWSGLAAAVVSIGGYATGQATLFQALTPLVAGLLGIFMRDGMISHALEAVAPTASVDAPLAVGSPLAGIVTALEATVAQAQQQALTVAAKAIQDGLKDVGVAQ